MCNLRMLTLYASTYPEGDDRPKQWLLPERYEVEDLIARTMNTKEHK